MKTPVTPGNSGTNNAALKVAVLSYNHNKYSETFIQAQINCLQADVSVLYGGELPQYFNGGQSFLPVGKWSKLWQAWREVWGVPIADQHLQAVKKFFIQNRIQLVIANYAITAFPVMDLCAGLGIPLVVHFHGWTAYRQSIIEKHRQNYHRLFEKAAAIIAVSEDMVQQLKKLGAPEHKLHRLVYGFDANLFKYSDHSQNEPVFLSVGRFCDTKNPHLTLLAFERVVKQIPHAKLHMMGGDENLKNACVNLVKALRLEAHVTITGIGSHAQVAQAMQTALALVQHSATTTEGEKEGTPVTIIEAMASGLPVVATCHAGIQDIIVHGQTGLLCPEFDIAEMATQMVSLVNQRATAKEIAWQAHTYAQQHLTAQQYAAALNAVVHSLQKQKIHKKG